MERNRFAVASILFFAPFVHYTLKTNLSFGFSEADKTFIMSYVTCGYLHLTILLSLLVVYLLSIFVDFDLGSLLIYGLYAIVLLICICLFGIVQQKTIFSGSFLPLNDMYITPAVSSVLLSFLPGYNIWLRYHLRAFKKPFWRCKESLLWWTLWGGVTILTGSDTISLLFLFFITFRVILLALGIDVLPNMRKEKINGLFLINIEEIWCWVSGTMQWLFFVSRHTLSKIKEQYENEKSNAPNDLHFYIDRCRQGYLQLYDLSFQNTLFVFSYISAFLTFIWWRYDTTVSSRVWQKQTLFFSIACLLVLVRYTIMIGYRKFPRIPLFYELTLCCGIVGEFVYTRFSQWIKKQ